MTAVICAIFFVSGVSALVFESLWFRQAGLALGSSIWASSLVLAGFMGGLAAGSAIAARYGDRLRNPVRAYAIAEVAIAVTGIGIVYLLPDLGTVLVPWLRPLMNEPWLLNILRLLVAFLVLLVPSTAMGVTLPLLTKTLMAHDTRFGAVLGKLYGWNTLGAMIGAVLGEMVLVGLWGVRGTALAAGGLNMAAAASAAWLSAQPFHQLEPRDSITPHAWFGAAARPWLIAAFLSGFCLLALEISWLRLLLLFVMGHSVAFALMLAVVLAGIAIGGLIASWWLRRSPDADSLTGTLALTAGLLAVATYASFPLVVAPFDTAQISRPVDILRVGVPLMLPVSLISGALFTAVGAGLRRRLASATETTGVLTLANTTGAALGSLVGGFVLLPVLGVERAILCVAVVYGAFGALLWLGSPVSRRMLYATSGALLIGVALVPASPIEQRLFEMPVKRFARITETHSYMPGSFPKVSAVREGLTETLMYLEIPMADRPLYHAMYMNSIPMADTEVLSRRYMKLFVYWPMAIHPDPKRALLICYGIGSTAKAMVDSDSLDVIDVVDISRDVLEMTHIIYPDETERPLSDPRVRVHIEDGRYFLRTTEERYDLITAEPPPPRSAGVVNLYTREYFQLLYDRLADGGVVTYWLPLHAGSEVSTKAILHAFCDVFEDCSLWNAIGTQLMMVGTRQLSGPVSEATFKRQWQDPVVGAEMRRLGFERPEQLGALFIGDAAYVDTLVAGARPLVDDDPKLLEAAVESFAEVDRLNRSLRDVAAAQDRFRQSALITRLWPPRLRAASLQYFGGQRLINAYGYGSPPVGIEDAHQVLTQSPLTTLATWLLGSSADVQQILDDAAPAELAQPRLQLHLGIQRIAEREYASAVEPLRRAEAHTPVRSQAFGFRVYALSMSGQLSEAQRLVSERAGSVDGSAPFWIWIQETFGLRVGASDGTTGRTP